MILLCLASSTTPRRRNLLTALAQCTVSHFRSSSTKSSSWFLSSLTECHKRCMFCGHSLSIVEMKKEWRVKQITSTFQFATLETAGNFWRPEKNWPIADGRIPSNDPRSPRESQLVPVSFSFLVANRLLPRHMGIKNLKGKWCHSNIIP